MDYTKLDRNRERTVVFYDRVSTEHEAQLSALENQMQWYSDQAKYHPNWNVIDKYIEQKHINNLDESTYELVKGDFEPIVSEELWNECNRIRKAKSKPSVVVNGEVKAFSKRGTADFWQSKMKCKCGSSFRKDKWHKNKHKDVTYGYSCYNRIRHGDAKKREELGLDTDGFCDMKMICEWKLDLMAKTVFDNVWVDRQAMAGQILELIRKHYTEGVKEKGFVILQYI